MVILNPEGFDNEGWNTYDWGKREDSFHLGGKTLITLSNDNTDVTKGQVDSDKLIKLLQEQRQEIEQGWELVQNTMTELY